MSYIVEAITRIKCDGCGRQTHDSKDGWIAWIESETGVPKHNCPDCQRRAVDEEEIGV